MVLFFFFKQKTAYEVRMSDWSSDVCSSDLPCQKNRGKSTSRRSHVGCLALIKSARHQKELSAISIKSNVHFTRNRFAIDTDQSVAGRHVGLGYEVVTLQNLCPNPPRDFVTTKRRF